MGVKVQYNPSTGKASYNPVTGKVQVVVRDEGVECGRCLPDITPAKINVTFSGITLIDDVTCFNCVGKDQSWSGMFDANQTYELSQVDGSPCIFNTTFAVDITKTRWVSTDGTCSGGVDSTRNYTEALVQVSILAVDTVQPRFIFQGAAFVNGEIFVATGTPTSGCLNSSLSNNTAGSLGCPTGASSDKAGDGGTATIVEI